MESGLKLIAIDVGNTSTAIGLWSGGQVSRVSHEDGGFAAAAKRFKDLLAFSPDAVAYVSVVPEADSKWESLARRTGIPFRKLDWRGVLPFMKLDYPRPATIGADRLADAVGAIGRYGAPVLIMDFGTALTAAVVSSDRTWRGGAIAPGFPLMRDYLFERTAKLPRMKLGRGKAPSIGRSTLGAMRFGAIVGYRGMVREITRELCGHFDGEFKLVATGGFARWALSGSGMDFTIDPELTLFGTGLAVERALR